MAARNYALHHSCRTNRQSNICHLEFGGALARDDSIRKCLLALKQLEPMVYFGYNCILPVDVWLMHALQIQMIKTDAIISVRRMGTPMEV